MYSPRRVLLTGFGPFGNYPDNPSWMAVKTLHESAIPVKKNLAALVTALNIPTEYQAVLDAVPGFHAQPPILPEKYTPPMTMDPPEDGFDLIIHVGVGRTGGLCAERLAHKTGYAFPDNARQVCSCPSDRSPIVQLTAPQGPPIIIGGKGALRGFGKPKYPDAEFADELFTSLNIGRLVEDLTSGPNPLNIQPSDDPGRYLCDFIYYCSLAEGERAGRGTPVLFVHCPPVKQDMSTAEVAEGLKRIIKSCFDQL
ncbi:Proteophosphoglycan ppg4 [Mycena kentingensis (nom. inval.)]|nr:Proteophosphoglycan ppg4 [Mycena kentingensis (nom. inval.)]